MFKSETIEAANHAREWLLLDFDLGLLRWKKQGTKRNVGAEAGSVSLGGYRRVGMLGRSFFAHRVVWLLAFGEWPKGILDHKDRSKLNNAPANLRLATKSLNAQNSKKRSDNTTGVRGVGWVERKQKFRARICLDGKRINLGFFDCPKEAGDSYEMARRNLHQFGG